MSDLVTLAASVTSAAAARSLSTQESDSLRVAARASRRAVPQTDADRSVIQAVAWAAQAAREDIEGAKCPYCGCGGWDLTCWYCGGR